VATAPKVFFGVYSDAVGISGVFVDPREVESATSDDSVYSSSCSFATQEEAARFIRQTTVTLETESRRQLHRTDGRGWSRPSSVRRRRRSLHLAL
jgi:hypothetical protein